MSKYDKEREKLGLIKTGSTSSVSTGKSKYAGERESLGISKGSSSASTVSMKSKYAEERSGIKQVSEPAAVKPSRSSTEFIENIDPAKKLLSKKKADKKKPSTKLENPTNAVTKVKDQRDNLQQMGMASTVSSRKVLNKEKATWDEEHGRNIPVVGDVLRTLDTVAEKTKPFADIAREVYTPGGGIANVAGFTKGVGEAIAKILPKIGRGKGLIARGTTKAIEEATVGAPLGVSNVLARDAKASGKQIAEGAAYGVGGGAVAGPLAPVIGDGIQAFKQRGLRKEIGEFVGRMDTPRTDPAHPSGRIVQEAPSSNITARGDEAAGNIKRWEGIQTQFDKAVDDQFQLLKTQMDERGGVVQGSLVRDPTSGEVIDRTGRISNNPQWYRDYFAQNGRKPSQKELRALASEQVKKGYADDSGQIPPWKPADIEDIDGELASIRGMMDSSTDPAERAALHQVASTLETSRAQIKQQLPEGVKGRVAPRPLPEMTDNFLKPLNHYADTLYRETSANEVLEYLPGSNTFADTTRDVVYLANNKDLALGQGLNKGVMVEFDPSGMRGQVNTSKPTWEMTYKNGDAEFIAKLNSQDKYRNAVKSITVAADAQMDKATKMRLKRVLSDWEKQVNPDGSTTFFVSGKSPTAEGVQGRIAPGVQAKATPPVPVGSAAGAATPTPPSSGQSSAAGAVNPPPAAAPVTPPARSSKTITRTQLVNNIKKNLGVVIDTGRTGGGKSVLGVYKVRPEVIRTKGAQDHDTIAHEIGHHFVKKYRIDDPQFERELTDMMDTIGTHPYRSYPRNEWLDEGVAEYMRVYLADPQQAKQLAPKYSAFLNQKLPKDVRKALVSVQKDVKTWLDQGEYNQAKGMLDHEGDTISKPATKDSLYTRFIDDLHPVELMEKALKGVVGIGSKSIYKLARLSRGVGEQAKMAATRGIFDSKGNKLSKGLRPIVEPLEKIGMSQDDFATYLSAIHAKDLKLLNKEVPFSDAQMAAVLQRWGNDPVVQKAQKEIVKYNNALLDILVEGQIYSREAVDALKKKYPNYVPFLRYFDDDAVAGFKNGGYGSSSGFANVLNPVKRMSEYGSTRTIINPLESMIQNTFLAMNAAAKNKVGLQLADLSKIDGAGAWVEHVPGGKSGKEHIVSVWVNGKQQAFKIRDPELYNALLSLDHESANSLIKFLGGAAGILRAGATLTPEFMIRNSFRDVTGAIINSSKYGFNPVDFFKGFFHTVTKSDVFEKFVNSGGAMSTMMSLDRDSKREALETVFKKSLKDKAMNVVTSPAELAKLLSGYKAVKGTVGLLRKGAEISELSTKVGAFNKTLKKTGDIEEAAYTARDLMDFNRAGSAVRQANRAVAFLNASLQGTDKMLRSFKEDKAGFLTRAFTTLVLPAAGIYYWNQNLPADIKKKYENIPQWQKDSFFIIGIPGTGEFARIPKPFEVGMLFATSTERMLEWIQGNDPEAFKGYGRATAESLTPPMMLTALNPLLEAITNHSFFRDAPVVPQGEQRYEKKDQYGVYTSELSKEIGGFMDKIGMGGSNAASPRIIDNTIKGYTAGLGAYGVDLIDKGIEAVRGKNPVKQPAKKWTEDPFFRSFFVSTAGGGQVREDFYKKWEKIESAKASADLHEEQLPLDKQQVYMEMKPYKKEIDKLIKIYKDTQRSKELSAKEKRSLLDELDVKMNEAARNAIAVGK